MVSRRRLLMVMAAVVATAGVPAYAQQFFDDWNSAACGSTDVAMLTVERPIRLQRVDIWYRWRPNETTVHFRRRSAAKSSKKANCLAPSATRSRRLGASPVLEAGAEIEPGIYTFRTARAAICQNRASGGNGFIRAFGASVTAPASANAQRMIQVARDAPDRKPILDAVRASVERTLGIKVVFVVDRMTMAGDWAFASCVRDAAGHRIDYRRTQIAKDFDPEQDSDLVGALVRRQGASSSLVEHACCRQRLLEESETNTNCRAHCFERDSVQPLMNVPLRNSLAACCSSACVFITIGPYHATGSSIGRPETSRKRMPCSPACTTTSSPAIEHHQRAVRRSLAERFPRPPAAR